MAHPWIAPQGKRPIHDYEPAQISDPPTEDNLQREQIRAKRNGVKGARSRLGLNTDLPI